MPTISADIPASLKAELDEEALRGGRSTSAIVTAALASYLEEPIHTVFQVSTSGALVAGVYDREVSVRNILEHGDFGLGTFADLDGEMVVVDGHVYQVKGSGEVLEASGDGGAPFAVVTRFSPTATASIGPVGSFNGLEAACDRFRSSGNIFYALRLDGRFKRVRTRAVTPPRPGARRLKANLVHMVWIDGTYDMVAVQERLKYGRTSGIDFGSIDYIKYAEAFGATGLMIRTPEDIAPVMKRAFDTPGPVIVGVHVDYRENHLLFETIRTDRIH